MTTLAARRADAGPRTARGRFVPTRAGIINLWDYRDEEFVFADGWLVLRGPNGSGKTKALEVLFPFVLDGRIEPRRLNPFASEERTMKSNLLYRGQESTLAYAWLEFASTDEYVTVGVGLRAQRHSDRVTRWYFVADGRVGVDFALLDAEDRPIVRKHLVAQLGADAVRDSADEHRAAVDTRLFGLGPERYEQLINLVLTLRRPQLAKNLDPARLSDTLTEGLRPIDSELLIEAARSFDDMEAVQRTLDGLTAADEATKTFLGIYSTYLRTHARAAADGVSRRRADTDAHRQSLDATQSALSAATGTLTGARSDVVAAEAEPPRLRAHLDRLKTSAAYQSVGQLADLERLVRELGDSAERAAAAYRTRQSETARRTSDAAAAARHRRDREAEASRLAATLAEEAEAAGIAWTSPDAESGDFATRVTARVAGRQADVTAVRQAADRLAHARRDRDRAAEAAAQARLAVEAAEAAEAAAEAQVARVRAEARERLDAWARRHATPLAALDQTVLADLAEALAAAGEPEAPDLRGAFATAVAPVEQRFREDLVQLRTHRAAIDADLARVETERAAIAAEQDDAPVPFGARTAPRQGRPGAPLWRLVRFADGLPDAEAAVIEAALEAANLLDAWVGPSTVDSVDGDGYLEPLPAGQRPSGRTLADLLVAEEQDHVPAARIASILGSVAVRDVTGVGVGPPVVSAGGRFTQGIQLGGYAKPAAEFIGATARARRRALRLADCERRLAELRADRAGVDRECALAAAALDALGAAARDLPGVGAVLRAVRDHDRAATTLRAKREAADAASAAHDVTVAEAGAAETALRRTCAERSLPADQVEPIAEAVRRFERAGDRLSGVRREVGAAVAAEVDATDRLEQAAEQEETARLAAEAAERRQVSEAEQLATLQAAIGAAAEAVLRDVADTEVAIEVAESALGTARERLLDAEREVAAARQDVSAGEAALQTAVAEERREAQALAPFAHADLLELLRCPDHLRWPALSADWADDELPAPVVALHEAILAATKDLTPTASRAPSA